MKLTHLPVHTPTTLQHTQALNHFTWFCTPPFPSPRQMGQRALRRGVLLN